MALKINFTDDFGNVYPAAYAMLCNFGVAKLNNNFHSQFILYPSAQWRAEKPDRALAAIDVNAGPEALPGLLTNIDTTGRAAIYAYAKSVSPILTGGEDC